MILNKLVLHSFRNYGQGEFQFAPGVNVILGENGVGKTNLLEAVFLLSGRRSWRSAKNAELIKWDSNGAYIFGNIFSRGRDFEVKISMPATLRGNVTVNGVKITKKAQMSEVTRCVIFSPEDLFLIKGSSKQRRDLLDGVLCQLSSRYNDALLRYEKVLRFKQKILKDNGDSRILPEYNAVLGENGAVLVKMRAELCEKLGVLADGFHKSISGEREELCLKYRSMSVIEDPNASEKELAQIITDRMNELMPREIAAEGVLSGVHRDDFDVFINGKDAKSFASQGQSRTAAIALKFSERELLREGDDYPILLLDDVLSELDEKRQSFIANHSGKGQTFITCCVRPEIWGDVNLIEM